VSGRQHVFLRPLNRYHSMTRHYDWFNFCCWGEENGPSKTQPVCQRNRDEACSRRACGRGCVRSSTGKGTMLRSAGVTTSHRMRLPRLVAITALWAALPPDAGQSGWRLAIDHQKLVIRHRLAARRADAVVLLHERGGRRSSSVVRTLGGASLEGHDVSPRVPRRSPRACRPSVYPRRARRRTTKGFLIDPAQTRLWPHLACKGAHSGSDGTNGVRRMRWEVVTAGTPEHCPLRLGSQRAPPAARAARARLIAFHLT